MLDGLAEGVDVRATGLELWIKLLLGLDDALGAEDVLEADLVAGDLLGGELDVVKLLLVWLELEELEVITPESGGFKLYP